MEWFASVRAGGLFPFIAFVAPEDDAYRAQMVALGVRALQGLGIEPRVFTDFDAALRWLMGVPGAA